VGVCSALHIHIPHFLLRLDSQCYLFEEQCCRDRTAENGVFCISNHGSCASTVRHRLVRPFFSSRAGVCTICVWLCTLVHRTSLQRSQRCIYGKHSVWPLVHVVYVMQERAAADPIHVHLKRLLAMHCQRIEALDASLTMLVTLVGGGPLPITAPAAPVSAQVQDSGVEKLSINDVSFFGRRTAAGHVLISLHTSRCAPQRSVAERSSPTFTGKLSYLSHLTV
jgi:hypothetical protein